MILIDSTREEEDQGCLILSNLIHRIKFVGRFEKSQLSPCVSMQCSGVRQNLLPYNLKLK